jgi:hypothetical protein
MYEKKLEKVFFFRFHFFQFFRQNRFERCWTLCVRKNLAKSLGVLEGVTPETAGAAVDAPRSDRLSAAPPHGRGTGRRPPINIWQLCAYGSPASS